MQSLLCTPSLPAPPPPLLSQIEGATGGGGGREREKIKVSVILSPDQILQFNPRLWTLGSGQQDPVLVLGQTAR